MVACLSYSLSPVYNLLFRDADDICPIYIVEAFAVCENYSPPEGFNPKDLHLLLEKVGSPSGGSDLGKPLASFS